MHCRVGLVAFLAMAATAAATSNKTHTPKTHPTKDHQGNRRKVKSFSLCPTGTAYGMADDDDYVEPNPGYNGLYWITYLGECGVANPETIAVSSTTCAPTGYYSSVDGTPEGSIFFPGSQVPLLTCSQSYLFNTYSSKSGKACGSTSKYGDVYNTVQHEFVLVAPTGDDLTAFNNCIADQYNDDDDEYFSIGVYECLLTYYDVVTTDVVARGTDLGKNKLVDVDYAQDSDVWSFDFKGLGWNPFSTANSKSSTKSSKH